MVNEKILNVLNFQTELLESFEWDEELCDKSQEHFLNSIKSIYKNYISGSIEDFSIEIFKSMIEKLMSDKIEISGSQLDILFKILENRLSLQLSGKDCEKILLSSIEMLVLNESPIEE